MADVSSHMRREQVTLPSHVVDLAADELRSTTGDRVELRPRSLAVLRLLAQNAGRLVCKNEIIAEVWDDVVVTDDSLTQCIADIRKAIGDGEHRILRTVPRRGYLLVPSERKTEFFQGDRRSSSDCGPSLNIDCWCQRASPGHRGSKRNHQ